MAGIRKRAQFKPAAILLFLSFFIHSCSEPVPSQPHVVLVSVDTLRADHLGTYGYPGSTSPELDRLARRAVSFTNASSQASWTLPAHVSMHTSLYPAVHGVQGTEWALSESALTLAEVLSDRGYRTAAFVSFDYVSRKFGFAQGFDEFEEILPPELPAGAALSLTADAVQVTDAAKSWVKEQSEGLPLFLFVHYFDPHLDYSAPEPFHSMFDRSYGGNAKGTWRWLRAFIKGLNRNPKEIGPRDLEHVRALYDGEVRYLDRHLGRLLQFLDQTFGEEPYILVVTADHGEELREHGSMEGHQWTLYGEVLHVPLLIQPPGRFHAGSLVDSPAELVDIAPTILDYLRVPIPDVYQGQSLRSSMVESSVPDDSSFVYAEIERFNHKQSIQGPRYKLIHTDDTGVNKRGVPIIAGYELYDLYADPSERFDLLERIPTVGQDLAERLDSWRDEQKSVDAGHTRVRIKLSREERARLESLGYVE